MNYFRQGFIALAISSLFSVQTFSIAHAGYDDPRLLAIEAAPGKVIATYTPEQLQQAFPQHVIETVVPWMKEAGKLGFRGPYLKDVIAKHGLGDKTTIEAFAFDEYTAHINHKEIDDYSPIIAIETACSEADHKSGLCSDGQEYRLLRQEDNGFFRFIWPLDRLPHSASENDPRWIWATVAIRPAR